MVIDSLRARVELWTRNGYVTNNLTAAGSDGETDSGEEDDSTAACDIQYVVGDVTHPQHSGNGDTIAVHCVGMSSSPVVATKSLSIYCRFESGDCFRLISGTLATITENGDVANGL